MDFHAEEYQISLDFSAILGPCLISSTDRESQSELSNICGDLAAQLRPCFGLVCMPWLTTPELWTHVLIVGLFSDFGSSEKW